MVTGNIAKLSATATHDRSGLDLFLSPSECQDTKFGDPFRLPPFVLDPKFGDPFCFPLFVLLRRNKFDEERAKVTHH